MARARSCSLLVSLLVAGACTMPNPAFDERRGDVGDASGSDAAGDGDGDAEAGTSGGEGGDGDGDPPPKCGDGRVDPGEECDLGPENDDLGECTRDCRLPVCGDGFTQAVIDEACDLGPANGNGGPCRADCQLNECGDGYLGPGEGCEIDLPDCTDLCTLPTCGDGIVQDNEKCDDGNDNDTDQCTNACTPPVCGDGIVQDNEKCDDGNANNSDACLATCVTASCGDGFIQTGVEECDSENFGGKTCTDYDQIFGDLVCDECKIDSGECKLCLPLGGPCEGSDDCCQDGIIAICLGFTCVSV